jgi:2-polyprenyl-6-methoxyphenol hydroxylase-like FAD-dependent oxidoreductase
VAWAVADDLDRWASQSDSHRGAEGVMESKTVLISGCGIAGPTLAYWLLAAGFRPTLVEKAPAPRSGGYIIDFWGLGFDIAERMGMAQALRARAYDVGEFRIVDDRGRRCGGFGVEVFRELTGGRYVSLPRGDLARLIYDRIEGRCETIFGDSVTALAPSAEGVEVTFERSPERRFDMVIGADGLHSAVREAVFGAEVRFESYLGYTAAAFGTKGYEPRDENAYVTYGTPGKQVARFAMRDDRTMFLLVFAADKPPPIDARDMAAQKARLHAEFDDGGWECPRILAALDASDDLYFDRVSQMRLPAWSRGRVALVGDAAFAPSLLAGQGSALAMIAAYVLAGELAVSPEHPEAAFQRYELLLRNFMAAKQKAAVGFAGSFAPKTRLGLFVRDLATRLFVVPGLSKLLLGPGVLDRIELPSYPALS